MCNILFCDDLFYNSLKMKSVILTSYSFLVFDIEYTTQHNMDMLANLKTKFITMFITCGHESAKPS